MKRGPYVWLLALSDVMKKISDVQNTLCLLYINGLGSDDGNPIANVLELPQSCTKPSTWHIHFSFENQPFTCLYQLKWYSVASVFMTLSLITISSTPLSSIILGYQTCITLSHSPQIFTMPHNDIHAVCTVLHEGIGDSRSPSPHTTPACPAQTDYDYQTV